MPKKYGNLTVEERRGAEESFKIIIGHGGHTSEAILSKTSKPRLGINVDTGKRIDTIACHFCGNGIPLTRDEARLLESFEAMKKWYDKAPPEWDGTWSKKGILAEGDGYSRDVRGNLK